MKSIKNPKAVQSKSRTHEVTFNFNTANSNAQYTVTSGASSRKYVVKVHNDKSNATCSCNWGKYKSRNDKRSGCSHVAAVFSHIAKEAGRDRNVSMWSNEEDAQRQHRPVASIGDNVILTGVANAVKAVVQQPAADDYSEFEQYGPIFA